MKYKISKNGKHYLDAEEIESLKEILIELARQNKGDVYSARHKDVNERDPCAFFVKRYNKIIKRDGLYFKQDTLKTSESTETKIFITETIYGEERIIEEKK